MRGLASNLVPVRKHRAPKGALRLEAHGDLRLVGSGRVRKHRAPEGALRLGIGREATVSDTVSESTERQKVH